MKFYNHFAEKFFSRLDKIKPWIRGGAILLCILVLMPVLRVLIYNWNQVGSVTSLGFLCVFAGVVCWNLLLSFLPDSKIRNNISFGVCCIGALILLVLVGKTIAYLM